ncbi:hypothetical protein SmphiM12_493 [Sinorhizobium phage phiM12]|uniref:Transmembrane protein n=1 Tax=Sinorhizobium phage phiM12 TaxID=1357423 RepID=S5MQH7_9CAUD|nr:hypothetical protein AB690_gp135 [Sinorhizobium phage phiM12]AGR48125.1 hypothetical protein SmphiM12_493 [Sinorhizobium phage phiM12]
MNTALSLLFRADFPTVIFVIGMIFSAIAMSVDESGKPKPPTEIQCKTIKETDKVSEGRRIYVCEDFHQ